MYLDIRDLLDGVVPTEQLIKPHYRHEIYNLFKRRFRPQDLNDAENDYVTVNAAFFIEEYDEYCDYCMREGNEPMSFFSFSKHSFRFLLLHIFEARWRRKLRRATR